MQQLPRELQILLAQKDLSDLKSLAAKAVSLHTHHQGFSRSCSCRHHPGAELGNRRQVRFGSARPAYSSGSSRPGKGAGQCCKGGQVKTPAKSSKLDNPTSPARLAASLCWSPGRLETRRNVKSPTPVAGRETRWPCEAQCHRCWAAVHLINQQKTEETWSIQARAIASSSMRAAARQQDSAFSVQ